MKVLIDGQDGFAVEGTPEDVLAVFAAASAYLSNSGRSVLRVQLDGNDVTPVSLQERLRGLALESVNTLEITSGLTSKLVTESLREIESTLSELPGLCRQLAEVFQGDSPEDGFESFHRLAEIWAYVKEQQVLAANALDLDLNQTLVDGESIQAMSVELNRFLTESAEAIKNGDTVLLGDLLEYELAPRAEKEAAILAAIRANAKNAPAT